MVNLLLRHLFQGAIRAGRRVREETGISKNAMSVSSVAVDLANQIIGDLSKSRLLVIGTGEAGRLVAKASKERGVKQIAVASRTLERATELADILGGKPVDMYNYDELVIATSLCASFSRPVTLRGSRCNEGRLTRRWSLLI
jgi:glutamyl-tRNA reductase